ncbi:Acyl-CoA N-acyltransferase [Artemisia annua]|uniref:Acyl-CoA N-acyltransferase n=1 Tax=Artemisia annua TaxID=35608 RepID=A0A2U1M5W2_ARTAN|nr:Acyl-CoA N-acyltransferase [Artemisia annua]
MALEIMIIEGPLGLNHVNFFDEVTCDNLDTPNDDNNSQDDHHEGEGGNSLHLGSPTIDHEQGDLGHSAGSNEVSSASEMAATPLDVNTSEGVSSPLSEQTEEIKWLCYSAIHIRKKVQLLTDVVMRVSHDMIFMNLNELVFNKLKLRTRTVKRKTTNQEMELNIRPKRNIRAPKMCGFLVEPVFKRTRRQVLRLNAVNNVATETPPVANTVNNNDNSILEKQAMHDQDQMLAILVQAGWNVSDGKDPVYIDHQGIPYWSITKAFCVLAKLVQDGKAKRRESSAFALVPKDRLSNLIRRVPNEAGIQDSGVGSVEGTGHEGKQSDDRINDNQCNVCGHQDGILVCCDSFHRSCVKKVKDLNINSSSLYFCGTKCHEILTKLNESFGKKTQLQDGFSFSLLKSYDLRKRLNKIDPIKAECKAKLAQAFDILNQCFLPSIDAINNTNVIQHLVYNQGSHIRRLSYSGFFTAILEKDDEVISTATIRIHGNKLAEMPFVGTREKYWSKGMCRRLLDSIENVLGSFGVEELVLPSTSTEETLQIWTKLGFKPLKESTKQTMKYMSIAVFRAQLYFRNVFLKTRIRSFARFHSIDIVF